MRASRLIFFLVSVLLSRLLHAGALQLPHQACNDLRQRVAAMEQKSKNLSAGKELCFEACTKEQIPAATFWGHAQSQAEREIHAELSESASFTGQVNEVDLNGDGVAEVRIARRVGTASCVRDTYLKRTTHGYTLIHTPSLMQLSAEAGNCGDAGIVFLTSPPVMYAIETTGLKMQAYRIDKDFNLVLVCVMPR
jgi:hypothetical protein